MAQKKITPIKKSEQGSLTAIAKRDNGLTQTGKVSKTWARDKLANPRTTASTKKKINFFLNI